MAARGPILGLVALAGCAGIEFPGETGDGGFRVIGVSPAVSADDVVETANPELRLISAADAATCTPATIRVDGVDDAGAVAFSVPIGVNLLDGGERVQLQHERTLPRGWRYAITVRGGSAGCTDLAGRTIEPFFSSFYVP